MSSANDANEDPFLEYLFTRLLPFLNKYKLFLLSIVGGLIMAFLVLGIYSSHREKVRKKILNDVYNVLSDKENINIKKLAELNKKYKGNPASLEAKWILASEYTTEEKYDNAAKIYTEIIEIVPDNPLVIHCLLSLGSCYESQGKHEEALDTYTQGIKKYNEEPYIKSYFLYRKARSAYYSDNNAEAEKFLTLSEQELPFLESDNRRSEMASKIEYLRARIQHKKN